MDTHTDKSLYNFITGKVFPMSSYKAILSIHSAGRKLKEQFIKEKLMQNNTVSICGAKKRASIPTSVSREFFRQMCCYFKYT